MRTLIRNCKLYLNGKIVENCFLVIDAPLISDFGVDYGPHLAHDIKLNAKERLLLPGFIDSHAHLRDQGLSYKEDLWTGTASAVLGGVTSVIDMPNNLPPTATPSNLVERMKLAKGRILANVGFTCKPSADHAFNSKLIECGAMAFKMFVYEHMDRGELDLPFVERVLESLSKLNKILMLHCNAKTRFSEVLELVKSKKAFKLCRVEKELAERILAVAKKHGARVHFCHVTCPRTVKLINDYKSSTRATLEVAIHHLLLDYSVLKSLGPMAHVDPPLRSRFTTKLLFDMLRKGMIDVVVSDHAPHAPFEKEGEDPKPGFPNLQLMMPLLMTQVKKGRLDLGLVVDRASTRPAQIFGLKRRGAIVKGYYADLVEVDLKRRLKVKSEILVSKAKYTPFEGTILTGVPVRTYVNGVRVNDDYAIVGKGGEGVVLTAGDALYVP
jgi:dihydroorotase